MPASADIARSPVRGRLRRPPASGRIGYSHRPIGSDCRRVDRARSDLHVPSLSTTIGFSARELRRPQRVQQSRAAVGHSVGRYGAIGLQVQVPTGIIRQQVDPVLGDRLRDPVDRRARRCRSFTACMSRLRLCHIASQQRRPSPPRGCWHCDSSARSGRRVLALSDRPIATTDVAARGSLARCAAYASAHTIQARSLSEDRSVGSVPWPDITLDVESTGIRAAKRLLLAEATTISPISDQHCTRRSSAQWARSNSARRWSSSLAVRQIDRLRGQCRQVIQARARVRFATIDRSPSAGAALQASDGPRSAEYGKSASTSKRSSNTDGVDHGVENLVGRNHGRRLGNAAKRI